MTCNRCGCDALIKDGDWYKCPQCGNQMFDIQVTAQETSPTKQVEQLENQSTGPENGIEKKDGEKTQKSETPPKKKKSKLRETIDFCIPIVIAVVIAMILKTLVFANAIVPTGSMLNTIQQGDRIIASRLAYINENPQRYDVVIFNYPDDESQYFVKRVIGLPCETVEIVNGVVYVTKTDGETIQLDDSFVTNGTPVGNYGPYEVPEDCYFMMGDNRNESWDSRFWENKYVEKDKILGKVLFRYYPTVSTIE